jgi:hypothetical protein
VVEPLCELPYSRAAVELLHDAEELEAANQTALDAAVLVGWGRRRPRMRARAAAHAAGAAAHVRGVGRTHAAGAATHARGAALHATGAGTAC